MSDQWWQPEQASISNCYRSLNKNQSVSFDNNLLKTNYYLKIQLYHYYQYTEESGKTLYSNHPKEHQLPITWDWKFRKLI